MKLSFHYYMIVLLFGFVFNSCKQNPVSSSQPSELLPLKVGNSWILRQLSIDFGGNVVRIDTVIYSVLRDSVIDSLKWYITTNGTFRNSNDGLWILYPSSPFLLFKYPGQVGETITLGSDTVIVRSTNQIKATAAGSFTCYHYTIHPTESNGFMVNFYLSPGVGWISFEDAARTMDGWTLSHRYELLASTLR